MASRSVSTLPPGWPAAGASTKPVQGRNPSTCMRQRFVRFTGSSWLDPNAVKLRSGPVEDIDLRRGVVFDDLVVGVFDVGVADGDSADHSRTGSEAAFR